MSEETTDARADPRGGARTVVSSLRAVAPPAAREGVAAHARMGEPPDRAGAVSLTDRCLTRDGRPWFPVMGEYHFSRDRADRWEEELLVMKAGGVGVVATYLIWSVHEERRGALRWDGDRDVRRFLALAARHGLLVVLRVGPWVHGEARHGGFPDWLQALDVRHRTNDPRYQELVRSWFAAVAGQVGEFLRTDATPDAPVVGIQADNELYDDPEHLAWLRAAAEEAGLVAPLWTATAWGGARLPEDLLPIYAGYPDGFWAEADEGWPDFGRTHYAFSTVRDDLTVGADLRTSAAVPRPQDERFPWVTCELGAGMVPAYHRRPLVDPEDVAALALVKLGSGSAWQGYYLFHGGTQVVGETGSLQESQATGYPNDLPALDYDYGAPVGAHGQLREHYHLLRQQHLFLERAGASLLGSAVVVAPAADGAPRWSYRGTPRGGHLFLNHHQPAAEPLPDLPGVQLRVELDDGDVVLPSRPVTLRSGVCAVWPVRQPMGGLAAVSGTVQPVTEVATAEGPLVVVAATRGVPVELVLEGVAPDEVSGARVLSSGGGRTAVAVDGAPGPDRVVRAAGTTVVVLDPRTAARTWRGEVGGVDTALVWDEGLLLDAGRLRLRTSRPEQRLLACPPLARPGPGLTPLGAGPGVFSAYAVPGPEPLGEQPTLTVLRAATAPAPRRTGGPADRASAPRPEDLAGAALVRVDLPAVDVPAGDLGGGAGDRLLLTLDWVGDVATASVDGVGVADQFWHGRPWDVPVEPGQREVHVTALPLDPASAVFLDPRVRPGGSEPVLEVRSARLVRSRLVDAAS
ncbi:beta-galactosidase [Pseudokineococcus sp. 5B2Z-1]|uniref:beta-galactosidase n=1 Tax=Pseudokineococcus sp. 5B2Z-1 TaxID=3132744 RepID=UPI00309E94AC